MKVLTRYYEILWRTTTRDPNCYDCDWSSKLLDRVQSGLCSKLNSKLQRKVISFLVDKSFAIFSIIIENRPTWNHPMNNFFLIFNWTIFLVIDSWHCFSDPFLYCLSHYDLYLLCLYKCPANQVKRQYKMQYTFWKFPPLIKKRG